MDYCLDEWFNATCRRQPGHVILMTSARFGRMTSGRCISGDFNVGCVKDVLNGQERFERSRTSQKVNDVSLLCHGLSNRSRTFWKVKNVQEGQGSFVTVSRTFYDSSTAHARDALHVTSVWEVWSTFILVRRTLYRTWKPAMSVSKVY